MSIAAQLAQNTQLFIAGTTGSAKTITAAVANYPTIITSAAHGLSNGDNVAIAAITGTMGTDATNGLNGKSFTIKNVTTNTFAIEANTTGLTYTSGGTATPSAWIQIKEVKAINPSGGTASAIDVTDLDSLAMESLTGLQDHGTLSFDINILETDAGQAACLAAFAASASKNFKTTTSLPKTRTFTASITKWPTIPTHQVNGVQVGTAEVKISGAVTVS